MEPLATPELDSQALVAALESEAQYERIWLPPEPWWPPVVADKANFAAVTHRKLIRGAAWPRSETIDVRKPGHGIRPVSLMSPDVRMIYRAIASALVPEDERLDRSAERYAEFVMEPVRAAYDYEEGLRRVGDAKYTHIVLTDIAAFYQYIDHSILRDEFDLAGKSVTLTDGLVGLLGDIEGRSFGIPQRSAPSDWVADVYCRRLERWVIRDGFDVWRYSDDFRIGCTSYAEALRAIESLSRAARDIGLVLNDQKTATPSFLTYVINSADVEVHDASAEIDPSDVEAAVSTDYAPEDADEAKDEARQVIEQLWDPESEDDSVSDEEWDLRHLNSDQHRTVRRALNTLTKHEEPSAMPRLLSLLAYQPAMTHRVVRYAEAVRRDDSVPGFFDKAIERLSLNEWQRAWMAYGLRACEIDLRANPLRATWLRRQLADRPASISAAEAAVTLSESSLVPFEILESHLRTVSEDFAPWYLYAIALLRRAGAVPTAQIGALRQGSPLAASILR